MGLCLVPSVRPATSGQGPVTSQRPKDGARSEYHGLQAHGGAQWIPVLVARGQRRKDWDTAGTCWNLPCPQCYRVGDSESERVSGTEEGMFSISVGLFLALLLQSLWKLHVPSSVWKHDEFFKSDVH